MYINFYVLYRFVMIQTFFDFQTFHIILVPLQLLLTNLNFFLKKTDVLAMKIKDHQLTKMVLQMVHSLHILNVYP